MLDNLRARGVKFHSFTEAIDTATPSGRAMLQIIGVLAELKKVTYLERNRAGVKAAQRPGREIWSQGEADGRADGPCPETDRKRKSPALRRRLFRTWAARHSIGPSEASFTPPLPSSPFPSSLSPSPPPPFLLPSLLPLLPSLPSLPYPSLLLPTLSPLFIRHNAIPPLLPPPFCADPPTRLGREPAYAMRIEC